MNITNEIIIGPDGNATVCGELAQKLWRVKSYPRLKCSANSFYVMELIEMPQGFRWDMKAAQTTKDVALRYMDANKVLIDISNAPGETKELKPNEVESALIDSTELLQSLRGVEANSEGMIDAQIKDNMKALALAIFKP